MRVRIGRFSSVERERVRQPTKTERIEVSNRKCGRQGRAVGQTPGTVGTAGGLSREVSADVRLAQFHKPHLAAASLASRSWIATCAASIPPTYAAPRASDRNRFSSSIPVHRWRVPSSSSPLMPRVRRVSSRTHQLLFSSRTFGFAFRRERFGPFPRSPWSFTPPLLGKGQHHPELVVLPLVAHRVLRPTRRCLLFGPSTLSVVFAVLYQFAPHRRPHHPVLVHRLAPLIHASFRPRLATTPLRFSSSSPPPGWTGDFHPQAVEHVRHTKKGARLQSRAANCCKIIAGFSPRGLPWAVDLVLPQRTN